jgi:3-hydroxybutyryl-CoA dehydrogenase
MGRGIAQVFASNPDLKVTLYDVADNGALEQIESAMQLFIDRGVYSSEDAKARLSRMYFTTDLNDANIVASDMVVEAVFEDMVVKQQIFKQLEEVCRTDCIFTSNTSVMSPSEISANLKYRSRFVGTHFWNPAHLIPLVEVVKTDATTDEVAETAMNILIKSGKKAVLCQKDVPGFIANRMQQALWREAAYIVDQGIADAKTVDDSVKYSFGLRLPQLGPCENMDMVGLDLTYNIHDYVLQYLDNTERPVKLLTDLKASGKLGFKTDEGFLKWTPEEQAKAHRDLSEYLLNMLFGGK